MLTARSRAVVAWMMPYGEIFCPQCALSETSPLELARIEVGLGHEHEDSPRAMIAYTLDEYHGERLYEEAEMARSEGDEERARQIEEDTSGYPCDRCGQEIET